MDGAPSRSILLTVYNSYYINMLHNFLFTIKYAKERKCTGFLSSHPINLQWKHKKTNSPYLSFLCNKIYVIKVKTGLVISSMKSKQLFFLNFTRTLEWDEPKGRGTHLTIFLVLNANDKIIAEPLLECNFISTQ